MTDAQALGADPDRNVWVSASAGAGKTQVLAARMLRLLLAGIAPDRILALTFTRAAAAEMQGRVLGRLAHWATGDTAALRRDLEALRIDPGPAMLDHAARLLDRVVDARGGLGVRTIHAFAQHLLAGFPIEAGLAPGFVLAEARGGADASHAALAAALSDPRARSDFEALALHHGPARVPAILGSLGSHREALAALGAPGDIEPGLRAWLGLPRDGSAQHLLADAVEARVDPDGLARFAALAGTGGERMRDSAGKLAGWLSLGRNERAAHLDLLFAALLTGAREPKPHGWWGMARLSAMASEAPVLAAAAQEAARALAALQDDLDNVARAAQHLRAGQAFCEALAKSKSDAGLVDFDDLLDRAAELLCADGGADWVRRKLDQRYDHLLVDEAQDSNARQWQIVEALAAEHGAGAGEARAARSIFAVGDFKQSIFGFQGAAPGEFLAARRRLEARGVAVDVVELAVNYRSTAAILDVVDQVLADVGATAMGLEELAPRHVSARRGAEGAVVLWPPVTASDTDADEASAEPEDTGFADAPGASADERLEFVSSAERSFARQLAREVRRWLDDATAHAARGRRLEAGDILILVRRRADLIGALGAALEQAGVPVAGPDRMALTANLAVKDLLSLIRFVIQPGDDLALCEVLMSPMGGLVSHDALTPLCAGRRPGERVWDRLRSADDPDARSTAAWLAGLMATADFRTPARWLREVLDHPERGAVAITARLGRSSLDPIHELLNAAHQFAQDNPQTLRTFLHWITRGDATVKRDPDAPGAAVRLMTVHGAKGLQAPVVILADATARPHVDRDSWVPVDLPAGRVPFHHCGKATLHGALQQAHDDRSALLREEELRLLYVAMTRAEDRLYLGGALSARDRGAAHSESWWSIARESTMRLGAQPGPVDGFAGDGVVYATGAPMTRQAAAEPDTTGRVPLPPWAIHPAPQGRTPVSPLRPSQILPAPPAEGPGRKAELDARRRGRLLHLLFERLSSDPAAREAHADAVLVRSAPWLDAAERATLVAEACAAVAHPDVAGLFGPAALAEAALAGLVGDAVIEGRVDRLLVEPGRVRLLELKTSTRIPADASAVHPGHLAQLAAYWAVARRIWPDRNVEAGLLYTAGPHFIPLEPAMLARHAPDRVDADDTGPMLGAD